jgi:hypothetical protein
VETLTQVCCFPFDMLKNSFNGVAGGKLQPFGKVALK